MLKELLDIPKLLFPGSSGETLHPKTQWVRNEGRSPRWVLSCCHLEESLVESIQKNWVRLTSLYLPISLHSHTPQMDWQFSASTNIKACDYNVLQSKIIQHTQISLRSLDSCKWEGWDRVMCFHGCSGQLCFVWEEETNCIPLCGREKFSKFRVFYHLDYFLWAWFSTFAIVRCRSLASQCDWLHPAVTKSYGRQWMRRPNPRAKASFKSLKGQSYTSWRNYLYTAARSGYP